jgi:deoxycytidylate deaminase
MNKKDAMVMFTVNQSLLSKCTDKKTAAVLVSADLMQVYSIGINGGPKGGSNCLCTHGDGAHRYTCVHAEMNCLVKNRVIDDVPKIMICTKQPCAMCASLIINAGTNIIEVWYIEQYWDNTGIDILREAGIKVISLRETDVI